MASKNKSLFFKLLVVAVMISFFVSGCKTKESLLSDYSDTTHIDIPQESSDIAQSFTEDSTVSDFSNVSSESVSTLSVSTKPSSKPIVSDSSSKKSVQSVASKKSSVKSTASKTVSVVSSKKAVTVSKKTSSEKISSSKPASKKTTSKTASKTFSKKVQATSSQQKNQKSQNNYAYSDMKCIWLSQYDCSEIYCNNGKQRSISEYKSLISVVLKNIKNCGFNTIFVQVRPNADSIYPSDYFPPSAFAVGEYGNSFSYDPISILVKEAHNKGLSIHAWINPLRSVTDAQIKKIPNKYQIKQWYNNAELKGKYIVRVDGRWYLSPAYSDVRNLIVKGTKEIMTKYSFDGLHMDDYFYPTTAASFDSAAYDNYQKSGGKLSVADFRRSCLNKLVKSIYQTVKSVKSSYLYGISPEGNVDTVYNKQYADVYLWCSKTGYVDYICPQVYFGLEHETFDFSKVSNSWNDMISKESGVKLLVGMSLGKALSGVDSRAGKGKNEWSKNKDVLKRCLEVTGSLSYCTGVSYFCYQYFYNPVSGVSVDKTNAERNNFLPLLKKISWKN